MDRREITKIAVPVSLESLLQLGLGFINQIIVGTLGVTAIAAVGLANNTFFIGVLCLSVFASGCSIMAAKALGQNDQKALAHVSSVSLGFALLLSLLIAMPIAASGVSFLRLVGATDAIATEGGAFLSVLALSLPLMTAGFVVSAVFRTIGQPRVPLVVTVVTLSITPILAWLFVVYFAWGAIGAAWATLITQSLRAVLLLGLLYASRWGIRFALPNWAQSRLILLEMMPLVLPLFVTEIVFSSGLFVYALIAEKVGTAELAILQIVSTLETVFFAGGIGLHTAATILVSKAVGGSERKEVMRVASSLWHVGLKVGLGLGLLFALSGFLVPILFPNTTVQVQQFAFWGVILNACFIPVKFANMIGFGVLSGGRDTRFLLFSDVITVVVVGLPISYFLALNLGLWGVFLGRLLGEESVRLAMIAWRYRSGLWFKLDSNGINAQQP